MTDIKSISKLVSPIAEKYGADRVAAAFIDELEKAFGGNVDVITDTSNDIRFLEQIKKDEVVVYEAERSNSADENNRLFGL